MLLQILIGAFVVILLSKIFNSKSLDFVPKNGEVIKAIFNDVSIDSVALLSKRKQYANKIIVTNKRIYFKMGLNSTFANFMSIGMNVVIEKGEKFSSFDLMLNDKELRDNVVVLRVSNSVLNYELHIHERVLWEYIG